MPDWVFAQNQPSEQLCKLEHFSMKKQQASGEIEFLITVKEYVTPPDPTMKFFAQADKQTNQNSAPFTPCGWGHTIYEALSQCLKAINKFPYEGDVEVDARYGLASPIARSSSPLRTVGAQYFSMCSITSSVPRS